MNPYIIIGLCVASGLAGWETRGWKDGVAAAHIEEAQQINTINAEKDVIVKERKADDITKKTEMSYATISSNIDSAYSLPTDNSTGIGMSVIPKSAARVDAGCFPTKEYKLTPKQCDTYRAKLIGLRQWITDQRAAY